MNISLYSDHLQLFECCTFLILVNTWRIYGVWSYHFTIKFHLCQPTQVIEYFLYLHIAPIHFLIWNKTFLIISFRNDDDEVNTGVLSRSYRFLGRVVRAAVPIQALMLLLLGVSSIVPLDQEELICTLQNNLKRSFEPMLGWSNGPPPICSFTCDKVMMILAICISI